MFEIGFWELLLIAVLGLVVLGPERLPAVARKLGLWAGSARGYMRQLGVELDREIQSEQLRRSIKAGQQAISDAQLEMQSAMQGSAPRSPMASEAPMNTSQPAVQQGNQ
jgi:sec-independent protein translocase protein TatB